MKYPVKTINTNINILDANKQLQTNGIQQMPVLSEQQHLIGMLDVKDLLKYLLIDGDQTHYVRGKSVQDAMSNEVITADPVSDIRRIASVMQEYHLNAIPIVNERDSLIGIVSRSDILRAVMNDPPLTLWS
jgi:CBS domain-containing protein